MRKEVSNTDIMVCGGLYLLCLFFCIYLAKEIIKIKYKRRKEVYGRLKSCVQELNFEQKWINVATYELIIDGQTYERKVTLFLISSPSNEEKFYYNKGIKDTLTEYEIRKKVTSLKICMYVFLPPVLLAIITSLIY